MGFVNNKQWVL